VLVTSRSLPPTPWVLVYKIDRDVALGESDRRALRLVVFFALAWRSSSAASSPCGITQLAPRGAGGGGFPHLASRFESQGALLRLVTDSQPNASSLPMRQGSTASPIARRHGAPGCRGRSPCSRSSRSWVGGGFALCQAQQASFGR